MSKNWPYKNKRKWEPKIGPFKKFAYRKINHHIKFADTESEPEPIVINKEPETIIVINKDIKCLQDLIDLGNTYVEASETKYNIDLKTLNKLVNPLTDLNLMIGMHSIKQDIIDHILFKIQNLDDYHQDMMHTVIQGPPGAGKTEVAKIIGKIYLAMDILKNDIFIKASRSELIGDYLGQTSIKTQKMIDKAIGGVLFIDEVYSLGNPEKRDIYAKECIDCINENLTTKKSEFICIIAGYKKEIETCFFSYNPGLERRFPICFTIEEYKADDLFLIFKKKVKEINWTLNADITEAFFTENYESFKYFGGDIEILLSRCKRSHSRRIFTLSLQVVKKELNLVDLKSGFETFKLHRNENAKDEHWKNMYM